MYLVVFQCDVVLVHVVPLLDADLLGPGADLRRDELLEVTDGVVLAVCEGGGGRWGVGYGQVRALGSLRVRSGCPPWGERWGGLA